MSIAPKEKLPLEWIAGTPRLSSSQLKIEQDKTLATPRRSYGILGKLLFLVMDILYGRPGELRKFKVLEIIARMPYQAWENVAYVAITHAHAEGKFARRIFDRIEESRRQQDNEQWHLLILTELISFKGLKRRLLRDLIVPQIIAFVYYHISWILYVLNPAWSYILNADFEDHAEHEYMNFVKANPGLESEKFQSVFEEEFGKFENLADLFRQIGCDERFHKEESLERAAQARFS